MGIRTRGEAPRVARGHIRAELSKRELVRDVVPYAGWVWLFFTSFSLVPHQLHVPANRNPVVMLPTEYYIFSGYLHVNECQALEEVGDVDVTVQDMLSIDDGRAGRRWIVSFTPFGHPAHVGKIQVTHKKLLSGKTFRTKFYEAVFDMKIQTHPSTNQGTALRR